MDRPIIIFDIDGTLADCRHRDPYLRQTPKDWKSFFAHADEDIPIKGMQVLNQSLFKSNEYLIYLCTGRHEGMRTQTEAWLKRFEIHFDRLFMRKQNDFRQDFIVKKEMLAMMPKENILFVIDDRTQAVQMWRREGLLCLQCAEGDY